MRCVNASQSTIIIMDLRTRRCRTIFTIIKMDLEGGSISGLYGYNGGNVRNIDNLLTDALTTGALQE